ncbi:MAG: RNA methyltransferase [Acidobacteria bacterium]|nr:RNA methyltransferase [Acidobacteriota bacterium]
METSEKITSRDNGKLVAARKVREGKVRSQIFIEGRRLAVEALRSDIVIDECLISNEFRDAGLIDAVRNRTQNVAIVADRIFKTIADTNEPQGIVLIARRPSAADLVVADNPAKLKIVLFLNEINNPSNLGAILRTSEAAGVVGVIVSANSADVYSPKAIRAAMGSSFRLKIRENALFEEVIAWANERELITTAADVSATFSYADADWRQPRLLIFGSEAHGLSVEQIARVDEKVLIPMENGVESLNLGVSAGIILFEAKRQA